MNAAVRIGGFAVVLGAVFTTAAIAGSTIDPSVDEGPEEHASAMDDGHESRQAAPRRGALAGLAVADGGLRLVPEQTRLAAGPSARFGFRIVDENGHDLRELDTKHTRRMHLIVLRRDFQNFQHVHPRQLEDGSWEARLSLSEGGVYRAFADFATEGRSLTLATDLFVPGRFDPLPLPAPATTADAGDGYEVTLSGSSRLRFTVTRDGRQVDAVEPYLGADGHLVVLREHDQAFLHTHPEGDPGGPGPIVFDVEYPSPGRYRLFLQFKHGGDVHTAAFTQDVEPADVSTEEASHGDH
jgi:hypothetical protein